MTRRKKEEPDEEEVEELKIKVLEILKNIENSRFMKRWKEEEKKHGSESH